MPYLGRVNFRAKLFFWNYLQCWSQIISSVFICRTTWLQAIVDLSQVTQFSSGMSMISVRWSGAIIFLLNSVFKCVKPPTLVPAAFTAGFMCMYPALETFVCLERDMANQWQRMGQEGLGNVILRHTDPHKSAAVQKGTSDIWVSH